jgi:hypothetical protein
MILPERLTKVVQSDGQMDEEDDADGVLLSPHRSCELEQDVKEFCETREEMIGQSPDPYTKVLGGNTHGRKQ